MASDVDDLFAEIGAPNMTAVMGESVTQIVQGNTGDQVTLTNVIVDISDLGDVPVDTESGSEVVYWGKLLIPVSVSVTDAERPQQRDQFIVRGLIWHCEKIVSQGQALQTVRIKRVVKVSTKKTRVR